MMKRLVYAIFMGMLLSSFIGGYGQESQSAALESITEAEMRDHIYFLASDFMGGRIGPSAEYEIAAQYVASQFASAGVEPLVSDSGNMDGYFQAVPFEKLEFGPEAKWIVNSKSGKKEFLHNTDYKILEGRFMPEEAMDVVFAGYGIMEPELGWNDYENLDIEGKMVLVMTGAPVKKGEAVLPDSIHQQYNSMMGLQKKIFPLFQQKPASIVLVLDKETSARMPFDYIPSKLSDEMYKYLGAKEGVDDFRIPMIYIVKDDVVRTIFEGQSYDPVNIAEEGIKKYKTYQLKDVSIETQFRVLNRSELVLKNVVGLVRGTDPELNKEYIVVGAHLDHVASGGEAVANGADDNASGSSGVMEIAEAVAMNPPRRSVIFVAFAAEEMGLHGSHYFVNSGPVDIADMKFDVTLDMIGRTTAENKETHAHYVLADSKYESQLVPFISGINDATIKYPLIFDFGGQFSGSSDHASFQNAGIPAFFFFSGAHEDLHRPGDDADKIEYDKAVKLSRLAYLITMKVANMDEVPTFVE